MTSVKSRLEAHGLTEDAIAEALGPVANRAAMALHLRRPEVEVGRASLIRLFVLGEDVPAGELPLPVAELEEAGLVERRGELIHAPLRLEPSAGFLLAHEGEERVRERDYVGGVNNATRTLSMLTIREAVDRALDLGTGCGAQALLASRHAQTVVATDVSTRAIEIARLNASLNGAQVDLREGSWFEAVEGESFDLIVSTVRDLTRLEPGVQRRRARRRRGLRNVVRGAAAHLREGGYATVLCNWICRSSAETWQPLEAWVGDTGCDALLLAHEPVDPFSYAALWNEPLRRDPEAFAAAVERWLGYYESNGVVAVGIGAVVLRRRSGANRVRGFDVEQPAKGAAGGHLLRLFAALDAPGEDGDALLDSRLRLVDGHSLDQSLRFENGGYGVAGVRITLDDGVGLVATVEAATLPLLFALDPARPLRDAVTETDIDAASAVTLVQELLARGFLERL